MQGLGKGSNDAGRRPDGLTDEQSRCTEMEEDGSDRLRVTD